MDFEFRVRCKFFFLIGFEIPRSNGYWKVVPLGETVDARDGSGNQSRDRESRTALLYMEILPF